MKEIRIRKRARIMIKIGRINSKTKLFISLLITLNLFRKVALKWMQN